ncbi:hypothetical protein KOAAANKH_02532 [Brevundimonas sp. NIBR10]|uniref:hypothetical protein n=1 Tax=Brevundimonas sp. NIBR10 TaxID=3015997 RepID=UPI0022F17E6E|nr:hypothetical protein [Brevundimonas sp. NIBR10]WGM47650.1 hypothetical protein KOAAANKH_02532 [Brevundimonas sp. NIBR10]
MPSRQVEQKTFETGEVGEAHLFRADLDVRGKSLRRARNVRILVSGAVEARPGTERIHTAAGDGLVTIMVVQDTAFVLLLTAGRLDVFDMATRALIESETGCAWTLAMIQDDVTPLVIEPYDNEARVFHPTMAEQLITRAVAGTWSVAADAAADGIGGSIRQPYYRFAARSVSLTPSATTGSITLTASAAYFVAGHVGLRFRLQSREVEITAVTDSTTATATVIQTLYPTVTVAVTSGAGFEVGEVVQGRDTASEGEVVAVGGSSLTILMQSFTPFFYDAAATPTGEQIIGRNATTRVTAAPTNTTNAAVLDFDEVAESAVRGYAATGAVHRNRLWKARLPEVPFGVLASADGDFQDFQAGVADNDAIFVLLGDTRGGVVRHVVSAEQLLLATSRGVFYVPESEANPIRPTSFSVNQIGPDGASPCKPVLISEGVVMVEDGGGSVMGIFPTGDVRRSWKTADLSLLSAHLIAAPRSLAYVSGGETDPERYVYAANAAGTMPVVYYSDSAEVFGWTLWESAGVARSLAAYKGECWAVFSRDHGGTTVYSLEVFDPARFMDACVDVDDLQGPASGEVIVGPDGSIPADLIHRCAALAGATCSLMIGEAYIGEVTLDADGDFGVLDIDGTITLGRNFVPEIEPWPPQPAQDDRAHRRKQRIHTARVRWQGRYMAVQGQLLPPYRGGEDTSAAPPLRDEIAPVPIFGWAYEPTVTYTRPYPGPWRVMGTIHEVRD